MVVSSVGYLLPVYGGLLPSYTVICSYMQLWLCMVVSWSLVAVGRILIFLFCVVFHNVSCLSFRFRACAFPQWLAAPSLNSPLSVLERGKHNCEHCRTSETYREHGSFSFILWIFSQFIAQLSSSSHAISCFFIIFHAFLCPRRFVTEVFLYFLITFLIENFSLFLFKVGLFFILIRFFIGLFLECRW